MANPFGGFVHSSPLSSLPHDPSVTLASNCIRDYFGPAVQTVADCLQKRGGSSTLAQIIASIRKECRRVCNEERERLVTRGHYKLHRARGPAMSGYVVEIAPIRAALLVLLQHGIVKAVAVGGDNKRVWAYSIDPSRPRLLPRYPRFVEYAKKALDDTAAALVEELLIHGRMRTVEAVVATVNHLQDLDEPVKSDRYTQRQSVVESLRRLVEGGFIEVVQPLSHEEDEEVEFDDSDEKPRKKKRTEEGASASDIGASTSLEGDDPAVVAILSNAPYRNILPRDSVWRVNVKMFHDSQRAFCLGRLVAERFGHKVQSAGSMVTAALKLAAHKEHAAKISDIQQRTTFTPEEILNYIPKPVQQALEKKPGGIISNISKALMELVHVTYPSVVIEVEEVVGHPNGGRFEIAIRQLVGHLRERIYHQVIHDSHGELAARVCSILATKGHLEADAIAETAMVPAKDTREILHQLYRANYISLFTLQQSKQHNPASMVYLWTVVTNRMVRNVTDNVCTALTNLRLRRQHEVEVGKDWIERAKEAGETDENDHERDKENYTKFCQGLERLDNASLQLDETLMVLLDF